MLTMRQPEAVFTSVWFIRNAASGAGSPAAPMLKIMGTNICALVSVSVITLKLDVSGEG
jgi:hypothetical protein